MFESLGLNLPSTNTELEASPQGLLGLTSELDLEHNYADTLNVLGYELDPEIDIDPELSQDFILEEINLVLDLITGKPQELDLEELPEEQLLLIKLTVELLSEAVEEKVNQSIEKISSIEPEETEEILVESEKQDRLKLLNLKLNDLLRDLNINDSNPGSQKEIKIKQIITPIVKQVFSLREKVFDKQEELLLKLSKEVMPKLERLESLLDKVESFNVPEVPTLKQPQIKTPEKLELVVKETVEPIVKNTQEFLEDMVKLIDPKPRDTVNQSVKKLSSELKSLVQDLDSMLVSEPKNELSKKESINQTVRKIINIVKEINTKVKKEFQIKSIDYRQVGNIDIKMQLDENKKIRNINQTLLNLSALKSNLKKTIETNQNLKNHITSFKLHSKSPQIRAETKLPDIKAPIRYQVEEKAPVDLSVKANIINLDRAIDSALEARPAAALKQSELNVMKFESLESSTIINNDGVITEEQLTSVENTIKLEHNIETSKAKSLLNLNSLKPEELTTLLQERSFKAPANSSQELKIELNPEQLGKVNVKIIKENNQLTIQMHVDNDMALKVLKQEVLDLNNSLRAKGIEIKDIEVAKSTETTEQELGSNRENTSHNEAKEEQKKRYTDTVPEWVKDSSSVDQASFESYLNGILN